MLLLHRTAILVTLALLGTGSGAYAEAVTKVEAFMDWQLFADDTAKHLFCFVTSEPKTSLPAGASREAPRAYISAWPKDGVKAEVSFRMGFPIKKASDASVTVSPATFKLFAADDRAYMQDPTQELKLVEAMKKGATLTIEVTSERGTAVTDTYSLSGLGQALQKLQEVCF